MDIVAICAHLGYATRSILYKIQAQERHCEQLGFESREFERIHKDMAW
jgi:hypothetical protein